MWLTFLSAVYIWQIYRMGGFRVNQVWIVFDLVLSSLLLILWMAFFSQFVLPLRKVGDRSRIFFRVLGRLFGSAGPAIFIKNGIPPENYREEEKGAAAEYSGLIQPARQ